MTCSQNTPFAKLKWRLGPASNLICQPRFLSNFDHRPFGARDPLLRPCLVAVRTERTLLYDDAQVFNVGHLGETGFTTA